MPKKSAMKMNVNMKKFSKTNQTFFELFLVISAFLWPAVKIACIVIIAILLVNPMPNNSTKLFNALLLFTGILIFYHIFTLIVFKNIMLPASSVKLSIALVFFILVFNRQQFSQKTMKLILFLYSILYLCL